MKTPRPVAMEQWARREHFEYYRHAVPCTYSITVELDVTDFAQAMRRSRHKTYIAQVWAIAAVVNRHEEFRLTVTDSGSAAVWNVVDPMFTVFNPERETFASVWAPYETDFTAFHEGAAPLLAEHCTATSMFPQGNVPANVFDVSSLPWASFTGFNLNVRNAWEHLAPIFTLGKYVIRENRTMMPLAIQVHHAAADGFHTSRLVNELQALFSTPDWAS